MNERTFNSNILSYLILFMISGITRYIVESQSQMQRLQSPLLEIDLSVLFACQLIV